MIDLTKLDDALRYKERRGAKRGGLNSPHTIKIYIAYGNVCHKSS